MLGTSSFPLMNPAPVSASCADDITTSIILEMTKMGAFWVGDLSVSRMGKLGLSEKNDSRPLWIAPVIHINTMRCYGPTVVSRWRCSVSLC